MTIQYTPIVRMICLVGITGLAYSEPLLAESASIDNPSANENQRIEFKLTLSNYSSQHLHADDLNMRAHLDNQTGWVGYYKEWLSRFEQFRGGYERTDQVLFVNLDSSIQAASHGFLGASITATAGEPFYGILGYGRTNLKNYANLNFDPNDAITFGIGWKKEDGPNLSLFVVRDDRVIPGEQNLHWLVRMPLLNQHRITLDIVRKTGPDNQGQSIKGTGVSFTYDWPRTFLRIAYDPKVNFTQEDMTRISIGMRF